MTTVPSPDQPGKDMSDWEVIVAAFIGFQILLSVVTFIILMPFAALEVLNDHQLHRGRNWEDEFAPRYELLLATAVLLTLPAYFIILSRIDPLVCLGRRQYALSIFGFTLVVMAILFLRWLVPGEAWDSLSEHNYDCWQGWG